MHTLGAVVVCFPDEVEHVVNIIYRLTDFLKFQEGELEPMRQTVEVHKVGHFFLQQGSKSSLLGKVYLCTVSTKSNEFWLPVHTSFFEHITNSILKRLSL